MTSRLEAIQTMDNPGLRRHVTDEPFLRVAHRRVASPPPMNRPLTDTTESSRAGYPLSDFSDEISRDGEGYLRQEDVENPPSPTGRAATPGPSVDNGSYGSDPWISAHHDTGGVPRAGVSRLSGAALTQFPGEVRQKRPATNSGQPLPDAPDVTDQLNQEQNRSADQRRIDTQKQVGGGSKENPAYERGQQLTEQRVMQRRLRTGSDHPLFKGAALVDSPVHRVENDPALLGLRHFYDTDYRPDDWGTATQQPMIQFKRVEPSDEGVMDEPHKHRSDPPCETCWLERGDESATRGRHESWSDLYGHPFKPFERHPNERYSAFDEQRLAAIEEMYEEPDYNLRVFRDTDFPAPSGTGHTMQPMLQLKRDRPIEVQTVTSEPGCETCYLRGRGATPERLHDGIRSHPFTPFQRAHNERYSHHDPDQDVHDVMDVQGADGNWNYDPYMHGMFNGMELVRAIHDGDEPEFREAPEEWLSKDAAADDEDDPRAEIEGLINGLPEAGSPVAHTRPTRDQMNTLAEMGFGRYGDPDDAPYWFRRDKSRDYLIQPGIDGYWESSSGPHEYWSEDSPHFTLPEAHPSFEEAVEHMRVAPRPEPARPGKTREFDPDLRDRVVNPGLTSLNAVRRQANDEDDWYEGSDYPSVDECSNCGSSSVEGVPGRSYCYDCGHTESPRQDFGPLKTRDLTVWDQAHQWGEHGKPGMEEAHPGSGKRILEDVKRGPGDITPLDMQRFNSIRTSAQTPNYDDPVYPYSGRVNPEDTVDPENFQSGDDTYRPHHPLVDRVIHHMQGLPDVGRAHPLMERVNEILNEGPEGDEDYERGANALAEGLNTIFDSSRETEGLSREDQLQRAKDAIDAHIEAGKLSHREHVKRLHDDWLARGGHATGEPRPVERFSPRYQKPQQIVPDPNNVYSENTSPIYMVGKCENCGRRLYDSAGNSGSPLGELGEYTVQTLDAAEHEASDADSFPGEDRRMHGPSALICPMCDQDARRQERVLDRYRGHKAGDFSNTGRRYTDDKAGIWHNPGEKPGECYECDHGITEWHRRNPNQPGGA